MLADFNEPPHYTAEQHLDVHSLNRLVMRVNRERRSSMASVSGAAKPTVVLVHGGFVDGSGWEGVYKILKKDGYSASIVQNPTTSLADDVAATRRIIDAQSGPVILVGHSYGGVVVTESGNHPKVAALVYIAA